MNGRHVKEVEVEPSTSVFMAVSAYNYYEADLAFWTLKSALGDREPTRPEAAHLDHLRQRRKDTYADLVTWTMMCEAERVAAQGAPS